MTPTSKKEQSKHVAMKQLTEEYTEGYNAYTDGYKRWDNPYADEDRRREWKRG